MRSSGLGRATPERLAAAVGRDGGPALSLSGVYLTWSRSRVVGVFSHTHLDHRWPTHHVCDHGEDIDLVCFSCGAVKSRAR